MRYPKKTYPKAFSVLFGILAAAFILFLICLGVQPAEPAKLSQTEDSQSDFASVSDPAASRQESNDEISQSDTVLEPPSDDKSLDTFVDWVIWCAEQEPRFPVKEDGSTVYGELFGDPYAQWSMEFLMYCFQKAEDRLGTSYLDSVYPWYPSSYSCGLWFKAYYHCFDVGTYIPARGDMILFDTYGIGYPDHIALVVEVADSAEGDPVIPPSKREHSHRSGAAETSDFRAEGVSFPARREISAKPVGDRSKLRVGCNRTPRVLSYIV